MRDLSDLNRLNQPSGFAHALFCDMHQHQLWHPAASSRLSWMADCSLKTLNTRFADVLSSFEIEWAEHNMKEVRRGDDDDDDESNFYTA